MGQLGQGDLELLRLGQWVPAWMGQLGQGDLELLRLGQWDLELLRLGQWVPAYPLGPAWMGQLGQGDLELLRLGQWDLELLRQAPWVPDFPLGREAPSCSTALISPSAVAPRDTHYPRKSGPPAPHWTLALGLIG